MRRRRRVRTRTRTTSVGVAWWHCLAVHSLRQHVVAATYTRFACVCMPADIGGGLGGKGDLLMSRSASAPRADVTP